MSATTTTVLARTIVAVAITLFVSLGFADHALAIEYGGIGGRPAFPDKNIPRSKSISQTHPTPVSYTHLTLPTILLV